MRIKIYSLPELRGHNVTLFTANSTVLKAGPSGSVRRPGIPDALICQTYQKQGGLITGRVMNKTRKRAETDGRARRKNISADDLLPAGISQLKIFYQPP